MTDTLFDLPVPEATEQQCNTCPMRRYATDDALRVSGWLVFDGLSVVGKPLHVRVLP